MILSSPVWIRSAGMLSMPVDFPIFSNLSCLYFTSQIWELCLLVLIDDIQYVNCSNAWMILQLRVVFRPSTHYCVFFCEAIPFLILDCADFSLYFGCEILTTL